MKYLSMLLCTAFMVSVFDKKNDQLKQTEVTDYRLTIKGTYTPIKNSCAGSVIIFEPVIETDTTGTGIKVSNLSYLPVNARVDREHVTFALDTFIYGYDEIVGTGSFSEDTLTLKLHHKPASFAPAGRSAFDCTTVLVKN